LPAGACVSYAELYVGLKELVSDLFQHIYLENDLLFPQAIARENALSLAANPTSTSTSKK